MKFQRLGLALLIGAVVGLIAALASEALGLDGGYLGAAAGVVAAMLAVYTLRRQSRK